MLGHRTSLIILLRLYKLSYVTLTGNNNIAWRWDDWLSLWMGHNINSVIIWIPWGLRVFQQTTKRRKVTYLDRSIVVKIFGAWMDRGWTCTRAISEIVVSCDMLAERSVDPRLMGQRFQLPNERLDIWEVPKVRFGEEVSSYDSYSYDSLWELSMRVENWMWVSVGRELLTRVRLLWPVRSAKWLRLSSIRYPLRWQSISQRKH